MSHLTKPIWWQLSRIRTKSRRPSRVMSRTWSFSNGRTRSRALCKRHSAKGFIAQATGQSQRSQWSTTSHATQQIPTSTSPCVKPKCLSSSTRTKRTAPTLRQTTSSRRVTVVLNLTCALKMLTRRQGWRSGRTWSWLGDRCPSWGARNQRKYATQWVSCAHCYRRTSSHWSQSSPGGQLRRQAHQCTAPNE